MQVILLERIGRLGQMGDTVKVKDGYARNFLLPQGRALRANDANKQRFESERAHLEERNADRRQAAQKIADDLDGKTFTVVRSAGETGQLYGSVATRDIVAILADEGFQITRNQVDLNTPIKAIGLHKVTLALHGEVHVDVTFNVARSTEEAERQAGGETLTSADAIYGVDDSLPSDGFFDPDADYGDEEGERGEEQAAGDEEDASNAAEETDADKS